MGIAGPILEACRRASFKLGGPRLRRLGVTSSLRGEGRSTVALAMALVQQLDYGRSALLLELDLENPSLAPRVGADGRPGLCELLRGDVSLERALQAVPDGPLFLAAGAAFGSPVRAVTELARGDILARVAGSVDVVVADLPPLLASDHGRAAAALFDQLLLVVRAGVTPVVRIREAVSGLPAPPAVLLNGVRQDLPTWMRRLIGT